MLWPSLLIMVLDKIQHFPSENAKAVAKSMLTPEISFLGGEKSIYLI